VARQQHGVERPEHAEPEPVVVEGADEVQEAKEEVVASRRLAEPSADYGDRSRHKASMCVFPLDIERRDKLARAWPWECCQYHTFHMAYYLLEYALVDDYLARRTAFREAHLTLAREAHRRGDLILAGALAEPADRAVLVWRTDDRSVVERFADGDPYVQNGLVTSWTIRPWTVVIGETAG
jgi:uncharacterized protein